MYPRRLRRPIRTGAAGNAATAAATSPGTEPAKGADIAAPAGAAGFTFGSTVDAARAACEQKFAWTVSAPDVFGCSGTPRPIGPAARSVLKFCDAALCRAVFLVHPESEQSSEWLHQFIGLKTALVGKYGEPTEDKDVPSSCTGDLIPCVREGLAHVKYTWTFAGGTYVVLGLTKLPGPDPVIRLTYARAAPGQAPAL